LGYATRIVSCDVAVVGGGSAGIAAAIGASQTGARTVLIERNPYFGGQATHSSLSTYCGFFTQAEPSEQVVGGVGQIVLDNLSNLGVFTGPQRMGKRGIVVVVLDPSITKLVLDRVINASKVTPLLHALMIAAEKVNGNVKSITCVDNEGLIRIEAQTFVDATGDANLTSLSGSEFVVGDGHGNMQNGSLALRIGGIEKGVLIDQKVIEDAISKAISSGIGPLSRKTCFPMPCPNTNDIMANLVDVNVNGLDAFSLTKAEMLGRAQAWAYLEVFRCFIPGCKNSHLVSIGPQIGIRETRHIIGEYQLVGDDVLNAKRREDGIARGSWPCEIHTAPGAPLIWQDIINGSYYDIPLGSLQVKDTYNLWAGGRIIAADQTAFSSIRVMGTSFATGQAAGVAAALFDHSLSQKENVKVIRTELLRQGAII
jgi:hypothetical protein